MRLRLGDPRLFDQPPHHFARIVRFRQQIKLPLGRARIAGHRDAVIEVALAIAAPRPSAARARPAARPSLPPMPTRYVFVSTSRAWLPNRAARHLFCCTIIGWLSCWYVPLSISSDSAFTRHCTSAAIASVSVQIARHVAHADFDRAEVVMRPHVPPDLADRVDEARVDHVVHEPHVFAPVAHQRRQAGRRQAFHHLRAMRVQPRPPPFPKRAADAQRQAASADAA